MQLSFHSFQTFGLTVMIAFTSQLVMHHRQSVKFNTIDGEDFERPVS